jgi:hypothetical protein
MSPEEEQLLVWQKQGNWGPNRSDCLEAKAEGDEDVMDSEVEHRAGAGRGESPTQPLTEAI